jgi:hypothetical protein
MSFLKEFGFNPPVVGQEPTAPVKKALHPQLIPVDAVHTGDGWCFAALEDGSVQVRVINPADGRPVVATVLTRAEFDTVLAAVRPPAPAASGGSMPFSEQMQAAVANMSPEVKAILDAPVTAIPTKSDDNA